MDQVDRKAVKVWTWRRLLRDHAPAGAAGRFVTTLLTLATWMDEDGFAFPNQSSIALGARISERTVRRHLADAERLGWLSIDSVNLGGLGWRRHEYRATVPTNVPIAGADREICAEVQLEALAPSREERAETMSAPSDTQGEAVPSKKGADMKSARMPDGAPSESGCGHERPRVRTSCPRVRTSATEGADIMSDEVVINSTGSIQLEGAAVAPPRPREQDEHEIRERILKLIPVMDDDHKIAETLSVTPDLVRATRIGVQNDPTT